MERTIFILLTLICLIFIRHTTYSQTSLSTSGGNAIGNGGTLTYTIGQLVYTTILTEDNGSISQGIQQGYEFQSSLAIESQSLIDYTTIISYPNPSKDHLFVKISNDTFENLSYKLFDINGRNIDARNITNTATRIETQHLAAGIYLLKVFHQLHIIKIIKIIKK